MSATLKLKMCEVPPKIQKCIRAVLLSKKGGVLVSAFPKDYKSLIQEALPHKKLGFDNIEDFLKAMPEVVRLEYSKKDMAYRAYGICERDTYQPTWMEKSTKTVEEKPIHRRSNNKRPTQNSNVEGDSINVNGDNEILPDDNGRYSIIYPRSKTPTYNEQNVRDKFQETGKISAVHMIDSWIFVRYMTAGEAVTARDMFKDELDTRFANSNKGKAKKNNYQLSLNTTSNHNVDINSQTFSNSFGGSFSGGISGGSFSGGISGGSFGVFSNTSNNSERSQKTNKDSVCYACGESGHQKKDCLKYKGHGQFQVYIGNLAKTVNESNLDEIIENRLVTRVNINRTNDGKKVIGFLTFTNAKDAEDVINQWNGKMYHGRVLLVRHGKHSKDREQNNTISTDTNLNISHVDKNHSNWKQKTDSVNENFGSLHINSTEDLIDNVPQLSPRLIPCTGGSDTVIRSCETSALPTQVLRQNPEMMKGNIAIKCTAKSPINRNSIQGFTPTILEPRLPACEPMMPPLEPIMPSLEPMMPELEPMMPELEPMMPDLESDLEFASSEIEDKPTQVFVANFPAGTTEKELYALFIRYGVSQVRMINNSQHFDRGCTKAFITLQSINDAVEAILDLDQTPYIDRMIKVAAPHGNDVLHQIVESRIQEYMSDSDSLPVSTSFSRSRRSTGSTNVGRPRSNDISYCEDVTDMSAQDASALLETFGHIRSKIQCKPPPPVKPGQKIKINVSAWLIEKYYFAQNWSEMECLREMLEISQRIQSAENHLGRTKGLGRCAALYKEEWFRAWILRVDESKHAVKVIYIDYGNVCVIPSKDTRVVPSWVWDLPAQAKPVRIATENGPFEKDMVEQVLPVTVKTMLTVDKCPVIEVTIDDTTE